LRQRIKRFALVALTAALTVPLFAGAAEAKKKKPTVPVKVMTRNIFLGADLAPALNATSFNEFTAANGAILAEVDATNFPLRAKGLAAEIKSKKPDLIGLQEVAHWRTGPTPGPPHQSSLDPQSAFTATETRYDFLALLQAELVALGLDYEVAVVKDEFDFEAPTDIDGNNGNGLFGGDIQGRLTMRDVILVNKDSKVKAKVKNPLSGTYASLYTPNISGIDVAVTRGWTAVDATVQTTTGKGKKKKKVKKSFRFVNSHFEAFDDETQVPSIRAQQATEVISAATTPRTIMLGDFNSNVPGVQPGDDQAFQVILNAGFERRTNAPGSCCVPNLVTGPASAFDHQVDHIVTNMGKKAKLVNTSVTGLEPVNGMFSSDHAGVFSTIKLK
jgi:endonuclease/exonuclease/phosphatase family metal-dependent hydrolase